MLTISCSIVALLDLADEHLQCVAFVIALDTTSPALGKYIIPTLINLIDNAKPF